MKLKKNKYIAFIFARGGSVGIKNKNLKKINGKTLVEISIDAAKKVFNKNNIYVSTDSDRIKSIAKKSCVNIINRPAKLSGSNSKEWAAWQHAIQVVSKKRDFSTIVSLPAVAPLRSSLDITNSIKMFDKSKADGAIGINIAKKNPWFNMVNLTSKRIVRLVNISKRKIYNRQHAPIVYEINTAIYIMNKNFVMNNSHMFDGKLIGVKIPFPRNLDIDDQSDLKIARFLMKK